MMQQGEESNAAANKCMLKVAQYAAQLENYPRAIEIYEQVSLLSSLLHTQYNARLNNPVCSTEIMLRCNPKFCDKSLQVIK